VNQFSRLVVVQVAVVDMASIIMTVLVKHWMIWESAGTALVLNAKLLSLTQYPVSILLRTLNTLELVIKSSRLVVKLQLLDVLLALSELPISDLSLEVCSSLTNIQSESKANGMPPGLRLLPLNTF
jgi:hypothetical protein